MCNPIRYSITMKHRLWRGNANAMCVGDCSSPRTFLDFRYEIDEVKFDEFCGFRDYSQLRVYWDCS